MIIFFYGEDSFRSHQKMLEIKDKYLQSDKSGSGLSSFDSSEKLSAGKLKDIFSLPNLLAPKRLVIVKRFILSAPEAEQKEVLFYLEKSASILTDLDLVVVFWEEGAPKKNNALFKFLEKNAKKQNFEKLSGPKLFAWALGKIREAGGKISREALEKLVAYAGEDTNLLDKEIQKLLSYSGEEIISEENVDILVRSKVDNNIFATIDAVAAGNKKEAFRLMHNHLKSGEDPFYLFSMLVYQFRNLLKVADLKEQGLVREFEIAKLTKLHPFVVKKSLGQLRGFSFSKLKNIYAKLADLDEKAKIGKIDMKLAIDLFIAEI